MKKGALAATAVAVGTGAATASVSAQEDNDEETGEIIVSGYDYYPDAEVEVLSELESGSRDEIIESFDDEFDTPDDWDVYVISVDIGTAGRLGHFFVDDDDIEVDAGDMVTMNGTASIRNAELNLLEVDATATPGEEEPEEEEPEEEEPEEEEDEEEPEEEDEPEDEEEPEDEPEDEEEENDNGIFG